MCGVLVAFAKDGKLNENDCKKIALHARPGWLNFLGDKGYKVKRYLYTKEIK